MPVLNNTFNFDRQEADPIKKSKVTSTVTDGTSTGRVPYEATTDLGFNTLNRALMHEQANTPKPTYAESLGAGIQESVFVNMVNKINRKSFDADPTFDATSYIKNEQALKGLQLSREEIDYIKNAVSKDDADLSVQEVLDYRNRMQLFGAHPVVGMVGSVLGDAPSFALGGYGAFAKASTLTNIIRAGSDIYDVGSTLYVHDRLGQSNLAAAMVVGTAAIDATFLTRGLFKAIDKNIPIVQAEKNIVAGTGIDETAKLVPDTDSLKVAKPTANIADDLGVAGTIPTSEEKVFANLSDNTTTINTNDIQVLTKKESKTINSLSNTGALQTTDGVPLVNVVGHLVDNTKGATDATTTFLSDVWKALSGAITESTIIKFAKASTTRPFIKIGTNGTSEIVLPLPAKVVGTGNKSFAEVINSMTPKQLADLTHEAVHAATVLTVDTVKAGKGTTSQVAAVNRLERTLQHVQRLLETDEYKHLNKGTIKYHMSDIREFAAGIVNDKQLQTMLMQMPSHIGQEGVLRTAVKALMQAFGIKPTSTTFSEAVDNLHDLITASNAMAKARAVPEFVSDTMKPVAKAAEDAFYGVAKESAEEAAASGMRDKLARTFKNNFMLHGQIAVGSDKIADTLVANPLATGARAEAVADLVRKNRSLSGTRTANVEDAIIKTAYSNYNLPPLSKFFSTKRFNQAVESIEADTSRYLRNAYAAEKAGSEIPQIPEHIKDVVDSFINSKWSKSWYDELHKSGMLDNGAELLQSDYYLPISYSSDKVRFGIRSGKFTRENVRSLLRQSIKDTMSHLSPEMVDNLTSRWERSLVSDTKSVGVAWRNYAARGVSKDVSDALLARGIPEDVVADILEDATLVDAIRPSIKEKNLKARNDFDYGRKWDVGNGTKLALEDIMEDSVTKSMQRYNARMSGATAFANKGYVDLSKFAKEVDDAAVALPTNVSSKDWVTFVDDTVNELMGYSPRGTVPDALRAAGYLSNALVLKNSGIYGITDIAFGMQQLGATKVLSSMLKGGLWTDFRKVVGNTAQANRMYELLNGAVKNDMKFRYIHKYTEDMVSMGHSSQFLSVAKNMGQGVHTVNGLRAVHSGLTNLYSGIVYDMFRELMLNGSTTSTKELKFFNRHGLSVDAINGMQKEFAKNPDALFSPALQNQLEAASFRAMDYLLQQSRLGETSHFASLNPLGRVVVGYNSFALGATTRVLGRMIANKEYGGLAMLFMYQLPLMLMGTYTKAALDGKGSTITSKDLIVQSLSNMGMIGIAGNMINLFNDNSPRSELAMLAAPTALASALNSIANGKAPDVTKLIPYLQTNLALRAIINNIQ